MHSATFLDCLLVCVANGMADALVSGTDEAMMYDSLQACGRVDGFPQVRFLFGPYNWGWGRTWTLHFF
jgi:hypothetical protein